VSSFCPKRKAITVSRSMPSRRLAKMAVIITADARAQL
jgi:hypothetical protein